MIKKILQQHVTDFYRSLLGTSTDRFISLDDSFWQSFSKLTVNQVKFLEASFPEVEIKKVVFACNPNKAPGLDSFSFQFYQSFWDLVSRDVCKLVNAFYYNQLDISKINLAVICLISKKKEANSIINYRPISLINYSFKIISKLLVNILALIMDSLIDQIQTAYIKERLIMDDVVCTYEVLHQVHISKT
jgi:Reverse transcriptase (RNA-dependent DNA polymerase)